MRFTVLGAVGAETDWGTVRLTAPRELALLAELLVHSRQPVTREHVADCIWGEGEVRHPAHALHTVMSRLRRRLHGDSGRPPPIETDGQTYVALVDEGALDALRFQWLVAQAQQHQATGQLDAASTMLGEGLRLWRGPALSGVPDVSPCVQAERFRLDELRLAVIEQNAELRLQLGRHRELVAELSPVVELHPIRERLRAILMLALYRSGRIGEALMCYRAGAGILARQLGIDPGPELQALQARILRADPELHLNASTRPGPLPSEDGLWVLVSSLQAETARLAARVEQLEAGARMLLPSAG